MGTRQRDAALLSEAERARHPWAYACDKPDCHYTVAADTERLAEHERYTHACPRKGAPMGKSILEKMWDQLDADVDLLFRSPVEEQKIVGARAQARCEAIALVMDPILRDRDEVWHEAYQRLVARQEGREHITPGLNPATAAADLKRALGEQ